MSTKVRSYEGFKCSCTYSDAGHILGVVPQFSRNSTRVAAFALITIFHIMEGEVVEKADKKWHICSIDSIRTQMEVGVGDKSLFESVESHNSTCSIIERIHG